VDSKSIAGRTLAIQDGRFTYTKSEKSLGWQHIALTLGTCHGTGKAGFEYYTRSGAERLAPSQIEELDDGFRLSGSYSPPGLQETVTLRLTASGALRVDRCVHNTGRIMHAIRSASAGAIDGVGGPVFSDNHIWRGRFCHMDNVRTEKYPWCRPEYPYVRPLPREETLFGNQESQPVPAMILTNDLYTELLLEGQLRQDRTRACWSLSAGAGQVVKSYELHWGMPTGGFDLDPGEDLHLEPVYYEILEETHPRDCWTNYFDAVASENDLLSTDDVLRSRAFYCSWNYGVFFDIDEERLLRTARFLSKEMPAVKHFLIDGGWQNNEGVESPSCGNFYLPEGEWHNAERFPSGLKAMADRLRETGLTPAIWWTPSIGLHSRLAREHPEWLAKDAGGNVFRMGGSGYLDYSLPPVQEYLNRVLRIIFRDWGYEAMKMDFWAQSVESDNIRFATGTGVQWRDWLLSTIRSYLPDDGFLMTCVAVAMGNPFLGKAASTYRCSIDVGRADWQDHVTASIWNLPLLSIPGRETCLLNVDGVGWNPDIPEAENLHRLTYAFITMGSLEVDGRLEELPPERIDCLNRILTRMDRGHPVLCPDEDAYTGRPLPKCLYVDYPPDSITAERGIAKHIALFNWTDAPQCTGYSGQLLGLSGEVRARDFWTDEEISFQDGNVCAWLPPRSARLFEVPLNSTG
jgi:hypothetical protein